MGFTEKIKELIARGASIDGIASSFDLDVSVLPPEWILFFSNAMMLTCSMMAQLESFNAKMEGMNENVRDHRFQPEGLKLVVVNKKVDALTSAIGGLQDSLRERSSRYSSNSSLSPSSDGYSKPNRDTSLRGKSGR